jgi:hypothetical protein
MNESMAIQWMELAQRSNDTSVEPLEIGLCREHACVGHPSDPASHSALPDAVLLQPPPFDLGYAVIISTPLLDLGRREQIWFALDKETAAGEIVQRDHRSTLSMQTRRNKKLEPK